MNVNSTRYYNRAKDLIPQMSQTMSKGPVYFPENHPYVLERGKDGHVWDVDGNEYIDYILGLGAVTLGYCNEYVDNAIREQLIKGISFSKPHRLEIELSELIHEVVPIAEMVRFSKTGSEVCSAAVKIARAATGRDIVLSWSYHGWHDHFSINTDRSKGIPKEFEKNVIEFKHNDLEVLMDLFDQYPNQIAAVFMEPFTFTPPYPTYLAGIQDLCHENGALFMLDEMVTGFRFKLGGVHAWPMIVGGGDHGLDPDIVVFGKGIANGMPLAVVCGRKEFMKECEEIFFSTTFGGETLSLAACKATIEYMREHNTQTRVWNDYGTRFATYVDGMTDLGIKLRGYHCRPLLELDEGSAENMTIFLQELCKRGILIGSAGVNFCFAHTDEDLKRTIDAIQEVLTLMKAGEAKLGGRPIQYSFRRL